MRPTAATAWTGGWMMPEVATGGCPTTSSDRQNEGPGKYASSCTAGLKTMCGIAPVRPLRRRTG